jgi:hypothetical protein
MGQDLQQTPVLLLLPNHSFTLILIMSGLSCHFYPIHTLSFLTTL